jgi:hypothetical protein
VALGAVEVEETGSTDLGAHKLSEKDAEERDAKKITILGA